jgi:5-methylcytosine-specific restriction endonuclease McrA
MDIIFKKCLSCNKDFQVYGNRKYQSVVCSRSCSHSYFKRRKTDSRIISTCRNCNKEIKKYVRKGVYCSNACRDMYVNTELLSKFKQGKLTQRPTLRKILSKERGYNCAICKISNYNNNPITLQVNHIDGICTNNFPENLELLCPNCHSQSDTFGGRNKGKGRKSLGVPLHF